MKRPFQKTAATVINRDGHQMIMLPSGEVLPSITKTQVSQDIDEKGISRCTVSLYVNVRDEAEARKLYGLEP